MAKTMSREFEDADPRETIEKRNADDIDEDDDGEKERASQGDGGEKWKAPQGRSGGTAKPDNLEPDDRRAVNAADHGSGQGVIVREIAVDRPEISIPRQSRGL